MYLDGGHPLRHERVLSLKVAFQTWIFLSETCNPSKAMQEMRQPEQYLVPRGAARPELKYHAVQLTCNVSCFSRTSEGMLADSYWHLNRVQVHGLHRFSSIVLFPFQLESSGSARHVSIPNAKVRARACCCSRCW